MLLKLILSSFSSFLVSSLVCMYGCTYLFSLLLFFPSCVWTVRVASRCLQITENLADMDPQVPKDQWVNISLFYQPLRLRQTDLKSTVGFCCCKQGLMLTLCLYLESQRLSHFTLLKTKNSGWYHTLAGFPVFQRALFVLVLFSWQI